MKKIIKDNQKGITLIALVITIIVLLILAGVAISMLSGENGILRKAASAKTSTEEEMQKEENTLNALDALINEFTRGEAQITNYVKYWDLSEMQDESIKAYLINTGSDESPIHEIVIMGDGEMTFPYEDQSGYGHYAYVSPWNDEGYEISSAVIGSGITNIGSSAFSDCTSLTSVQISDTVTDIGDSAFSGCISLESIIIPNSVIRIGGNVFSNCTSLTNITLSNSLSIIGGSAFGGCASLTSITIPVSITEIGSWLFTGASNLSDIVYNGTVEQWEKVILGDEWADSIAATVIQCKDGNVDI